MYKFEIILLETDLYYSSQRHDAVYDYSLNEKEKRNKQTQKRMEKLHQMNKNLGFTSFIKASQVLMLLLILIIRWQKGYFPF